MSITESDIPNAITAETACIETKKNYKKRLKQDERDYYINIFNSIHEAIKNSKEFIHISESDLMRYPDSIQFFEKLGYEVISIPMSDMYEISWIDFWNIFI